MRKMTNERQHQHAEALQSSTMHSLAKTVLETPKEGGCPLLPATSIASHLGGLPQATNKLINQGKGKQYIYSQWLQKNDILVYCYGIVPPAHACTFYRRWISKGTKDISKFRFLSQQMYIRSQILKKICILLDTEGVNTMLFQAAVQKKKKERKRNF